MVPGANRGARMERDGAEHRVSAASIHRPAHGPVGRQAGLPRLRAHRKSKRGRRRRNGRREPAIPDRTPIHQRPTKAPLRSQFGHWEGDPTHFRRQRDILPTPRERRSRPTLARRLLGKDAELTAKAITGELGGLPAKARRTLTYDNGGAFARHEAVTGAIGLDAYFRDPRSPWQRGSIENANGRIRRDLRPARPPAQTTPTPTATMSSGTSTPRLGSASATAPRSRHSPQTSVAHLKCESSGDDFQ